MRNFEQEESAENLLVGRNPVIEALRAGHDVERIYMAEGAGGSISIIRALAKEQGVSISMVDRFKLDHMAPGQKHQGVIAEIPAYHYSKMQDIFARAAAMDEEPFIVILDEITDLTMWGHHSGVRSAWAPTESLSRTGELAVSPAPLRRARQVPLNRFRWRG